MFFFQIKRTSVIHKQAKRESLWLLIWLEQVEPRYQYCHCSAGYFTSLKLFELLVMQSWSILFSSIIAKGQRISGCFLSFHIVFALIFFLKILAVTFMLTDELKEQTNHRKWTLLYVCEIFSTLMSLIGLLKCAKLHYVLCFVSL